MSNPAENAPKPDVESRLSALIDGELGGRARSKLERELAESPRLQSESGALRDLDSLLEDRPNPGEAPDLRAAVLARINRDPGSDASRGGGWFASLNTGWSAFWSAGWAAGGAACALMIWSLVHVETPIVTAEVTPFEDAIIAALASGDSLSDPLADMFATTHEGQQRSGTVPETGQAQGGIQ